MCDYSLHAQNTVDAAVGDKIISTKFAGTTSRGFRNVNGDPNTAVCLRPGTEIAFDSPVMSGGGFWWSEKKKETDVRIGKTVDLHPNSIVEYRDGIEFPNGKLLRVTDLMHGQTATVLQLPVEPSKVKPEDIQETAIIEHLARFDEPAPVSINRQLEDIFS